MTTTQPSSKSSQPPRPATGQVVGITYTFKHYYWFLRLLTVELYLFVFTFVNTMKRVLTDQLVEDKVCLQYYHYPEDWCRQMHTMPDSILSDDEDSSRQWKQSVLDESRKVRLYKLAMSVLPLVLATMLIGHWTDTYIKGKKYVLILGAIATIAECGILVLNDYYFDWSQYYILISYIPGIITGGLFALLTGIWAYILMTSPSHMITIRIAVAEIVNLFAQALGTYVGAWMLDRPTFYEPSGQQLHNYSGVYAIGGVSFAAVLVWTVLMVYEEHHIKVWEQRFNTAVTTGDTVDGHNIDGENTANNRAEHKLRLFERYRHIHPLKLLLNLRNGHKMMAKMFKLRPNYGRCQIWLLLLSLTMWTAASTGPLVFMYQWSVRVYSWDVHTYNNHLAIEYVIRGCGTLLAIPILFRFLQLRDTTLSLIGLVSYGTMCLIRGIWQHDQAYYYSIIPGCLGAYAVIGFRARLSKLLRHHEMGKIFSLFSAFEANTSLVSNEIYKLVYEKTVDLSGCQGLALLLTALVVCIPLVALFWIHSYTEEPDHHNSRCNDCNGDDSGSGGGVRDRYAGNGGGGDDNLI
ncbi:uncharacterized protein LOC128954893 [Oppia nitens]|uniref:uncharacterized protein LOC128954893 n=1 Tax=Oppia nitens TaxID=1686743 RepID=UPI0023D9D988|nr:uncharacterized protein LOC128954893 [Oppia nitens]